MSGTVNISRSLWDDPAFKDGEMTQREAWVWMIAEASWKDRVRRVGATEVSLKRGQLVASTRFLAKAWNWSEPRVRRYFDVLENRRMVCRKTDAGVTVVTICNYDKYQHHPTQTDAPATQKAAQDRRTTDANEKKGEIRGKEKNDQPSLGLDDAASDPSLFDEFWEAYPRKVGKQEARVAFDAAVKGGADPRHIIERAKYFCSEVEGKETQYIKYPKTWLNGKHWNDLSEEELEIERQRDYYRRVIENEKAWEKEPIRYGLYR